MADLPKLVTPTTIAESAALGEAWTDVRKKVSFALVAKLGARPAGAKLRAAHLFLEWAEAAGLHPTLVTLPDVEAWLDLFKDEGLKKVTKKDNALTLARFLLTAAAQANGGEGAVEEAGPDEDDEEDEDEEEDDEEERAASDEGPPTAPLKEKKMKSREEPVYEDEAQQEEEYEEEAPPSRRQRRVAASAQPVVVIREREPARRATMAPRAPPRPRNSLVPHTEHVNIYKRTRGGKKAFIGMFTNEDIGGSLKNFILEQIHEEKSDPGPDPTIYLVYAADSDGRDTGSGAEVVLESLGQPQDTNPLAQVRDTMDLVRELREQEEERHSELLTKAQEHAMEKGDIGGMMQLMMMDRMLSKGSDPTEMALKLAEKFAAPPAPAPLPPMFGGPLGAPPGYFPPMPPEPRRSDDMLEKMMNMMLMRAMEPPKSLADQLKEMMVLKEFMGGGTQQSSPELAALRQEVAMLTSVVRSGAGSAAPPPGSFDAALQTFTKISSAVKDLAPQINAGGITGAVQSILTPDLMRTLGNTAAEAIQKAQTPPGAPAKPLPAGQKAPAPQPSPQLPPDVLDAQAKLKAAAPDAATQAMVDYLQVLYFGIANVQLEPVMQEVMSGKVDNGRKVIASLLVEVRPDLVAPAFVDSVLRLLCTNAIEMGVMKELPKDLQEAKPAEVKPPANMTPAPSPAPTVSAEEAYQAQVDALAKAQAEKKVEVTRFEPPPKNGSTVVTQAELENVVPIQPNLQPREKEPVA